jgi:DNA-binding CsgD family transcriptional regulator
MDVDDLLDQPALMRWWLLGKGLESGSLEEALKWAQAADDFLGGRPLSPDISPSLESTEPSVSALGWAREINGMEPHIVIEDKLNDQHENAAEPTEADRSELSFARNVNSPTLTAKELEPARGSNGRALSPREAEILQILLDGSSNKMIARRLGISEATVKVHLKALMRKIGVTNRTQVALWALHNGIIATQRRSAAEPQFI